MSKYTAGPWTNEEGDITGVENDPENGCVGKVDVAHVYMRVVPGRSEANARLIAAAPDLLDALKEERRIRLIGQSPECGQSHWESMRDLRRAAYEATDAAIEKATGEKA